MQRGTGEEARVEGPVPRGAQAHAAFDRERKDLPNPDFGNRGHVGHGSEQSATTPLPAVDYRQDRFQIGEDVVTAASAEEGIGLEFRSKRSQPDVVRLREAASRWPRKVARLRPPQIDLCDIGTKHFQSEPEIFSGRFRIWRFIRVSFARRKGHTAGDVIALRKDRGNDRRVEASGNLDQWAIEAPAPCRHAVGHCAPNALGCFFCGLDLFVCG